MKSKWVHPDERKPNYNRLSLQPKKPSIWKVAKAQQAVRAKTVKITLPKVSIQEEKK